MLDATVSSGKLRAELAVKSVTAISFDEYVRFI